ncbi:LOW QUALITY PROTEIN: hypothetical protein HID58_062718 [Brassica napus]|uniref:Disease resistance protein Roq1-like winged-helix domain-containing protein n=1 Tax=Brassica napus TaxID=3708 RepID=A0ABQ8A257_BRANA|nr:LOW QUALITY PROTEIN: hypothetical protein HID58_062718 [Brassica napus]
MARKGSYADNNHEYFTTSNVTALAFITRIRSKLVMCSGLHNYINSGKRSTFFSSHEETDLVIESKPKIQKARLKKAKKLHLQRQLCISDLCNFLVTLVSWLPPLLLLLYLKPGDTVSSRASTARTSVKRCSVMDNESMMIEKIARDVSHKLNTRISRDFEDMVGIETHLKKMQSSLHLDDDDEDEAMIVGICGPTGIGKTTIARALHSRFSSSFQLTCFMENIRGSCNSGLDELENSLCQDIERVLKVGYDNLHENDQSLFLHIACFFNLEQDDYVMAMLSEGNLGLKTLAYKSLIEISTQGKVVMHKLLQQMGSQVVQRQEPWKRQILIDAHEICDVLETDSKMNLNGSKHLKEFPDLSNATNLEDLVLDNCESCSVGSLHKLKYLFMANCLNLQHGPTHCNLASLKIFKLIGSRNLRKIPDLSTNITTLLVMETMLEEVPDSFRHWSRLRRLCIYSWVPTLEKIPEFIKYLHGASVTKLASLPELPGSLTSLMVASSVLLETVSFSFDSTIEILCFPNCFKLGREASRFDHRAVGNSLIIRSDFKRFRICVVISLKEKMEKDFPELLCRIGINDCYAEKLIPEGVQRIETEHMLISSFDLLDKDGWLRLNSAPRLRTSKLLNVIKNTPVTREEHQKLFDSSRQDDDNAVVCRMLSWFLETLSDHNQWILELIVGSGSSSVLNLSDFLRSTASLFWRRRQI